MSFNPNATLDPGEVEDLRGGGGFGGFGGGGRMGSPVIVGGGGLGLLLTIALFVLNSGILGGAGADISGNGPASSALAGCQTGAQANQREDCRIVGFVDSVQAYWKDEFQRAGQTYQ